MEIEVIVSSSEEANGQKGIFDVSKTVSTAQRTTVEQVSSSFRDFCTAFSSQLNAMEAMAGKYHLEKIEMSVELTVKGELRIVASAGVESKGSIKLVFSR